MACNSSRWKGANQWGGGGGGWGTTQMISAARLAAVTVYISSVMVNQLVLVLPSSSYHQSWFSDVPNLPATMLVNHLASVCPYSKKWSTWSWRLTWLALFSLDKRSVFSTERNAVRFLGWPSFCLLLWSLWGSFGNFGCHPAFPGTQTHTTISVHGSATEHKICRNPHVQVLP
jgi:hypothetical protein